MDAIFVLRGLLLGLSIAAPVGPIGVLCIRRTLSAGRGMGLASGLGAATADATYGAVAAFGLTVVSSFLLSQQMWLRLLGGAFLCYLGVRTFLAAPATEAARAGSGGLAGAYVSTFFLTITNPLTILSFAAIFAGLGLGATGADAGAALGLVLGVFLGSALWWVVLSGAVSLLRARFDLRTMRWVNRGSGLLILGFGVLSLGSIFG
ncbi:MAG TPA: LysE family transporter [Chloroflexia bacterium]|jgi:threonine/homoserine/homoserine lactone efflux protein|nr:LysE family transporter [Chloroflexia bacterium]